MFAYSQFVEYVRAANPRFTRHWLNAQQESCVQASPHPPAFVVAGPGAGKTTVLALRVLKLILVDGIEPTGIIATTFTRKAASELRSRMLAWGDATLAHARAVAIRDSQLASWLAGLDINGVAVGTLDSLAEQFLADCRPPGGITPTTAEPFLATALMRRFGLFPNRRFRSAALETFLQPLVPPYPGPRSLSVKLQVVLDLADRARHDGLDIDAFAAGDAGRLVIRDSIADYLQHLAANHFADFARLEQLLYAAISHNQLQLITDRLKAILIDEFQDTNYLQEQIYFEFCRRSSASLTVVGDDDQSVFRFRGATVEIFSNFHQRLPTVLGHAWTPQRFDLTRNYRSTGAIVSFCNWFVQCDPTYQPARVPGKQLLVAGAIHAPPPHSPVLGMFRADCRTLALDLTNFLYSVFRGNGAVIPWARGQHYTIDRSPQGDFGDAVLLASSAREYASAAANKLPRERLPLLVRRHLESRNVPVFNPRGRDLHAIDSVRRLLGLTLLCVDAAGVALQSMTSLSEQGRRRLLEWRHDATAFAATDPAPGGLPAFVQHWTTRTPAASSKMRTWPQEWPLLDLVYTVLTWIPSLQSDPEGQVYLEAITRTIAEAAQFESLGGGIFHGTQYDRASIEQIIRSIFAPIANGDVDVDEEIMPYVPRSFFPIMTVHQAKGLEFPVVIVDVGSDFSRDHHAQRRQRFPTSGDGVHLVEQLIAPFCPIGHAGTRRLPVERAWDDLRRLYFVAFSRPENVLLLVGLTTQMGPAPRVRSVATGDLTNGQRVVQFIPAAEWHSGLSPEHVALI